MENKENKFKIFLKKYWFNIAIILFLFLISITIIEVCNYSYVEKTKSSIVFISNNSLGIIFICLVYYLFYYWIYGTNHNCKILEEYKRENNGNDKKYTAKFCEEDCIFEDIKKIKGKKKILETGKNVYLVDEKKECYHHIVDGYTFRKLGYPHLTKYSISCFSKEGKELKGEIKIYNIISDIKNILDIKNNI